MLDHPNRWTVVPPTFDGGVGSRCAIGLITLSADRVCEDDLSRFIETVDGVGIFSTRIPFSPVVTPESVAELKNHLSGAAQLLVPTSPLDVIAFGCTAGAIASGLDNVNRSLVAGRPNVKTSNPIEATVKALRAFKSNRISVLVPYHIPVAELVAQYFASLGLKIDRCTTFDLDGDLDINRVSSRALVDVGLKGMHPDSDALFISCTGLRTANSVEELEKRLGKPVITSNQALAWDCLRQAGISDKVAGRGRLLRL